MLQLLGRCAASTGHSMSPLLHCNERASDQLPSLHPGPPVHNLRVFLWTSEPSDKALFNLHHATIALVLGALLPLCMYGWVRRHILKKVVQCVWLSVSRIARMSLPSGRDVMFVQASVMTDDAH